MFLINIALKFAFFTQIYEFFKQLMCYNPSQHAESTNQHLFVYLTTNHRATHIQHFFSKIGNLNKETTAEGQQQTGDGADPIVEKACSNFMYKLMEFQRQHAPYSSQTLSYSRPAYEATSTVAPAVTTASPLNSGSSPSTSSSNLYARPIVSARSTTFGEYSSRLGEQTGDSTTITTANSYR